MKWFQVDPLPVACRDCGEEACYNCDHAGERWVLSKKDELLLRRESLLRAMERMRRQIEKIEKELLLLEDAL